MRDEKQGRVWTGKRALEVGLVDALGGLSRAVAIAKRELGIPDSEAVALIELSREQTSPLQLLSGGGASAGFLQLLAQVHGLPDSPTDFVPHSPFSMTSVCFYSWIGVQVSKLQTYGM